MTPDRDLLLQSHVCLQIPWSTIRLPAVLPVLKSALGTDFRRMESGDGPEDV
jgi:hypothetical protein